MNRQVIFLPMAEADLDQQYAWYLIETSGEVAERFLIAVDATASLLLEHPEIGAQRDYLNPRLHTLRMLPVRDFERHLVFYQPHEHGIDVVRVLHSARNVEEMMRDEPER